MSIVCMSAAAAGGHHDVSGAEGVQAYLYRDDIISMCTPGRHHDVVQNPWVVVQISTTLLQKGYE